MRRDAALAKEAEATFLALFTAEPRQRVDQIQLQIQGPLAFARPDNAFLLAYAGPPIPARLKLTEEQAVRASAILREGAKEIEKAASFPIVLESRDGPPTMNEIRKLVESPEFRALKEKAKQRGSEAFNAVTRRIEELLTDEQRISYHRLLGKPFDLSTLQPPPGTPRVNVQEMDLRIAAAALGPEAVEAGEAVSRPIPASTRESPIPHMRAT